MTDYLYSVHTPDGQEIVGTSYSTSTPSEVEAQWLDSGQVRLVDKAGDILATSARFVDFANELTLHRWVKKEKLGKPTSSVKVEPPASAPKPEKPKRRARKKS